MSSTVLSDEIRRCRLCSERFAQTVTAHEPRPVVWFQTQARILIAGQAPGVRVHQSQKPFSDPSGIRLRRWLGMDELEFYDRARVAIVPMAFCFPGTDGGGSDLAPPPICARTWHTRVMNVLDNVSLKILIGGYAHRWHLACRSRVTDTVANWQSYAPSIVPLPHPSWRNNAWLKANPWFEEELIPVLRCRVREVMSQKSLDNTLCAAQSVHN